MKESTLERIQHIPVAHISGSHLRTSTSLPALVLNPAPIIATLHAPELKPILIDDRQGPGNDALIQQEEGTCAPGLPCVNGACCSDEDGLLRLCMVYMDKALSLSLSLYDLADMIIVIQRAQAFAKIHMYLQL